MRRTLLGVLGMRRCGGIVSYLLPLTHVRTPAMRACHSSTITGDNLAAAADVKAAGNSSTSSKKDYVPHALHQSKLGMDGFTDVHYNKAADAFLEEVESFFDSLLTYPQIEDTQGEHGVVSLETNTHGIFLLNKQAPNVQIWLSSPLSGPHHYDMVVLEETSATDNDKSCSESTGKSERVVWRSDRDGHDLQLKLEQELSQIVGHTVRFPSTSSENAGQQEQ